MVSTSQPKAETPRFRKARGYPATLMSVLVFCFFALLDHAWARLLEPIDAVAIRDAPVPAVTQRDDVNFGRHGLIRATGSGHHCFE